MIKLYIIFVIIISIYLINSNIEGFEMKSIKFTNFDEILNYTKNSYNDILDYTENGYNNILDYTGNGYNDIKKYINNNILKEKKAPKKKSLKKTHKNKSEKCDFNYNINNVSPYYRTSYFDFNNF